MYQVVLALFPAEVSDEFGIKPGAWPVLEIELFAFAVVKPVEEVFFGVAVLPFLMVASQAAAVSVVVVHHLKKVLQAHAASILLSFGLLEPRLLVALASGGVIAVCATHDGAYALPAG